MENIGWIVQAIKRRRQTERGNVDMVTVKMDKHSAWAVCIPRTTPGEAIHAVAREQLKAMGL